MTGQKILDLLAALAALEYRPLTKRELIQFDHVQETDLIGEFEEYEVILGSTGVIAIIDTVTGTEVQIGINRVPMLEYTDVGEAFLADFVEAVK